VIEKDDNPDHPGAMIARDAADAADAANAEHPKQRPTPSDDQVSMYTCTVKVLT
jgi:hypothetical protein